MQEFVLSFSILNEIFDIYRLGKDDKIPASVFKSSFYSITKTSDELSIVCPQGLLTDNFKCEKDWRILKIDGPLEFSLIGIIANVSKVLAQVGISIFAISTYDTDYIIVKEKDLDKAIDTLKSVGHLFESS